MPPLYIYESPYPTPFLPQMGLFDYIFPSERGVSPLPEWDPSLPAFIDGLTDRVISRGELKDSALRLATGIRSLGVARGNVACIWAPNSIEWAQTAYGCMAAGLCTSPANVAYEPHEVAHQINDSGAELIFVHPMVLAQFEKARKSHIKRSWPDSRVVLVCQEGEKPKGTKYKCIGELFGAPGEAEHFAPEDVNETVWLCYSSGTTGLPKGVMTTHYNMTTQLQIIPATFPKLVSGVDTSLGFLPMSHMYGLMAILLQPLTTAVPAVLLPRFEEIAALSAIQKHKISFSLMVPPVVLLLVHSPNVAKYDVSSLKTVQSGAAPLSKELSEAFSKRFNGTTVVQGYGMTETSPALLMCSVEDAQAGHTGVGRIVPTYQVRLVREDGTDAPPGERGELWARGPNIMKGYHGNRAATEKTMAPGNWLKTGDVCVQNDQGLWHVVDRVKELIKYKGFQVAPAELEALLLTHPKIVDCGIVGVYDASQATELPRAYIVTNPTAGISSLDAQLAFAKEVQAWVAGRVAAHKRLRGGVVVTVAIPKSPSGKILRNTLRKRAEEEFCAVEQGRL